MGCIYKLTFKSGKTYIGQTVRTITTRMTAHRNAAAAGSLLAVHCAWREHGTPHLSILATSNDEDELHRLEREAIIKHGSLTPSGYNVTTGGDTAPSKTAEVAAKIAAKATGRRWSEEKKAQISEAMRQRWKDPEYRSTVMAKAAAAVKTESAREKFSVSGKARWERQKAEGWTMPESTKEKLRSKVVSAETRERMSASAKDRGMPASVGEKGAAALRGKVIGPYSAERKAATGAGVKAAWQDPVKRANLTAARKQAWATRRLKSEGSTGSVSVSLADPLFSEGAA